MKEGSKLKESYQLLLDWYAYRLEQNNDSLSRLTKLLSTLDRDSQANPAYEKEIVDLDSLKLIYETSIRNFESQIEKYEQLIGDR